MKILSKDFFLQSVATKNIMATFTVNVISPSDAAVTLTADGYTQQNNSITVPIGTSVHWEIEKPGYESKSGDYIVVGDSSITKSLSNLPMCTVSVSPTPLNATVSIRSIDGDWSNGGTTKSLRVPVGTELNITVVHPELNPYNTSVFAQEDTELDVILTNTITIAPDPEDALVIINGDPGRSRTQQCNAIVEWEVSKEGYIAESGTLGLNNGGFVPNRISDESGDNRLFVQLDRQVYAIQISVLSPSGVNIEAQIGDGEIISGPDSITVQGYLGDVIKWSATKEGYVPKSGEFVIDGVSFFEPIRLEVKKYLVTINPTPETSAVTISSGDEILKQGTGSQFVNVESGTELNYVVENGSVLKMGTVVVGDEDVVENVYLAVGTGSVFIETAKISGEEVSLATCYPVYASDLEAVVSTSLGDVFSATISDGACVLSEPKDLGMVTGYSRPDTGPERMVFYSVVYGLDEKTPTARELTVNPNSGSISVTDSRTFSEDDDWGYASIIKTDTGWFGTRQYVLRPSVSIPGLPGTTTIFVGVYENNQEVYSYSLGSSNVVGGYPTVRLSKKNKNQSFGRYRSDIGVYERTAVSAAYYDFDVEDVFCDDSDSYACAGQDGFALFDSSFLRVYRYSNTDTKRKFRLLGRISDCYYVISYPTASDASDTNLYLHTFYADGSGERERITITLPEWATGITEYSTMPQVSQTGYLLFTGKSGSDCLVVRVRGY